MTRRQIGIIQEIIKKCQRRSPSKGSFFFAQKTWTIVKKEVSDMITLTILVIIAIIILAIILAIASVGVAGIIGVLLAFSDVIIAGLVICGIGKVIQHFRKK